MLTNRSQEARLYHPQIAWCLFLALHIGPILAIFVSATQSIAVSFSDKAVAAALVGRR